MLKHFLVLLTFFVLAPTVFASTGESSLFSPMSDGAKLSIPDSARQGSRFVTMNATKFERLASGEDFLCVIEDFPLGLTAAADLRVEQFDVIDKSVRGKTAVPTHAFFRGTVDGSPNSHVFLALFRDRAFGYIVRDGITYSISAAGMAETGALAIGSSIDLTSMEGFACGASESLVGKSPSLSASVAGMLQTLRARPLSSPSSDSVRILTVALELDAYFVEQRGGTAEKAFAYALSTLAAASDIYTRDAGIALQCVYHTEYETSDPYTAGTACELLWEIQAPAVDSGATMWVTMSGRPTDWCGGIANGIGVICDAAEWAHCVCGIKGDAKDWSYPYKSFVWDIMVTAHETGHLVASPHTHNCFWNPPIDSCVESEGDCYVGTKPTLGTIMSYCHTTTAGARLVFHPLCAALMQQQVGQGSCYTIAALPRLTHSPSRVIEQCAGGMQTIYSTPHGGEGPYTIDVSPKADTIITTGSNWTLKLNASKSQRYFVRVTDALGRRSYDSIVFVPLPGFSMTVSIDTATRTDSAILTPRSTPGMGTVTYRWYRVGSTWSISTRNPFSVPRTAASYYCSATTAGGCVACDTFTITAAPVSSVATEEARPATHLTATPSTISLKAAPAGARAWIIDLLGRAVTPEVLTNAEGAAAFSVEALAAGIYYVVYEQDGVHGCLKFRK